MPEIDKIILGIVALVVVFAYGVLWNKVRTFKKLQQKKISLSFLTTLGVLIPLLLYVYISSNLLLAQSVAGIFTAPLALLADKLPIALGIIALILFVLFIVSLFTFWNVYAEQNKEAEYIQDQAKIDEYNKSYLFSYVLTPNNKYKPNTFAYFWQWVAIGGSIIAVLIILAIFYQIFVSRGLYKRLINVQD